MQNEKNFKIIFEKDDKKAVIPIRGSEFSAGYDLTPISYKIVAPTVVWFETGLKMQIPIGYFGAVYLRSGIAIKGIWELSNAVGVIDSDYRGLLRIISRPVLPHSWWKLEDNCEEVIGTRFAQIIVQPYLNFKIIEGKVNETQRGQGGFGSTGK